MITKAEAEVRSEDIPEAMSDGLPVADTVKPVNAVLHLHPEGRVRAVLKVLRTGNIPEAMFAEVILPV